ncbi:DUF721 domain-containing protein [Candidatus Hepatincolaceae symbiont of Richtersius coronifer]
MRYPPDSKHIFSVVKDITGPAFHKRGIHILKLIEDWSTIIPDKWQENSSPYKISWDINNKGTLHIAVTNHFIEQLISYERQIILKKINSYFGCSYIVDIKFKAMITA